MEAAEFHNDPFALAARVWRSECERVGVDPYDARLAEPLRLVPPEDALAASGIPAGWKAIAWLADRHAAALPTPTRRSQGSFYTPPWLAEALAARVARGPSPADGLIIDPACGAGALLAAFASATCDGADPKEAVAFLASRLRGTDTDPVAVAFCEFAVRIALLPAWARIAEKERPALPRFAEVSDGLSDRRLAAIVIANPPFGRTALTSAQRLEHQPVLYGHAHRPTLFVHAAVKRLTPGGRAGFVLPASVVGGAYYQRLRQFLLREAPPTWLAFVPDRAGIFAGDVLQESLLAVFDTAGPTDEVEVEAIGPRTGSSGVSSVAGLARGREREPWLVPRRPEDADLVQAARGWRRRLPDYGWRVSTGPLVWNRHREQLGDVPGPGRIPVIWASDLREGRIDISARRAGRFVSPAQRQEWLVLDEPAVLVQRTTAPEQRRRLIAAVLDSETLARLGGRVVVENHLNVCTWSGAGELTPERLCQLLESEPMDRLYRCITGSVAVSAFELNALPLPPPAAMTVLCESRDAETPAEQRAA